MSRPNSKSKQTRSNRASTARRTPLRDGPCKVLDRPGGRVIGTGKAVYATADHQIGVRLANERSVFEWPADRVVFTRRSRASGERPKSTAQLEHEIRAAIDAHDSRPTEQERLALVYAALQAAPPDAHFGRDKVFVSALYDLVAPRIGLTLPQFKRWLVDRNREQKLALSRADLVGAMDPGLVARSEISDLGATFNFVTVPGARSW